MSDVPAPAGSVEAGLCWPPDSFAEWCRSGGVAVGDTVMITWHTRPAFPFVVTAIGEKLILVKNDRGEELVLGEEHHLAKVEAMTREDRHG